MSKSSRILSVIKRFHLKYPDKQMEQEYITLVQQTNVENLHMSFYFLIFLLIIPGIPSLIEQNYVDLAITIATTILLGIIYYWKRIPTQYVQFLAGLIIASFNFCLFILPTSSFVSSSKGLMFFRGYAFASVNVILVSRFASLKQKIFFLLYCYAFRFALIIMLDPESAQSYTILRHFYIDFFVIYCNISNERKTRAVFKSFYDYREELKKFQDLLANYIPQAITVVRNFTEEPLFSNQSFLNLFHQQEEEPKSSELFFNHSEHFTRVSHTKETKPILDHLRVDKNTIREAGSLTLKLRNFNDLVLLKDIGNKLIGDKILGDNPISFNATYAQNFEFKTFEVILTKMKWDGKDAVAVILNDTTDQEKILSLKISDANKDKIIATVSHELRTPLNGIIGILDMVGKRVKDRKAIEFLGLCKDNAYLLLGLVNSMLDLQQIRQGKLRLNINKIEVARVIKDVTRLFAFQCKQKGLFLDVKIEKNIPKQICTDENRLKQILINLIGNALKFTSKGGITIEVTHKSPDSGYLQFSVADTGIGIREEDKEKLFKVYEKIENGSAVNKNGVGLGLTISNTLAGLLSRKDREKAIKVRSVFGEGSKFYFSVLKDFESPIAIEGESKDKEKSLESVETVEEVNDEEEFHIAKEHCQDEIDYKDLTSIMKEHSFSKPVKLHSRLSLERCDFLPNLLSGSPSKFMDKKDIDGQEECSNSSRNNSSEDRNCILAVDDNPFNLLVVKNIVKSLGYSVIIAKSGAEAIEIMKKRGNDFPNLEAILMDCQMPIMDGFETTKILREKMKKGEIRSVPIIALTANNGDQDIQRCLESGMVDHLSKPLFASSLLKALNALSH